MICLGMLRALARNGEESNPGLFFLCVFRANAACQIGGFITSPAKKSPDDVNMIGRPGQHCPALLRCSTNYLRSPMASQWSQGDPKTREWPVWSTKATLEAIRRMWRALGELWSLSISLMRFEPLQKRQRGDIVGVLGCQEPTPCCLAKY